MMCATCGHEHVRTEMPVRINSGEYRTESTMQICRECPCATLDPTDYEDCVALIQMGEIDG